MILFIKNENLNTSFEVKWGIIMRKIYSNDNILNKLSEFNNSYYINDIYRIINSGYNKALKFNKFTIYFCFIIYILISGLLFLFNIFFKDKINFSKKIAFARVDRTKNRIFKLFSDIQIISDDIKNYDFTIYRIGTRKNRLKFLFYFYIKDCIRDFKEIKKIIDSSELSLFSDRILLKLVKRIPHTIIYSYSINYIIKNYKLKKIYTGQMSDRFALVEEKTSNKYNKKLVCIPHGISSTQKMPKSYVGDLFYCATSVMAKKLNLLYKTNKFKYNKKIINKIYSLSKKKCVSNSINNKLKVIFFTQPLYENETKKIIEEISNHLITKDRKLYIKVHPNENYLDYTFKNTEIITDFKEAIFSNICISLFSTILIEASYNKSIPISIVNLIEDNLALEGRFDFLNDNRILTPSSKSDLFAIINKNINKEKQI